MPLRSINNTFNRGELDPALFARVDIDLYGKGAAKLRNMVPLWTGAARIAPGSTYTDIIADRTDSDAPVTDATKVKAFDFLYDADAEVIYTLVFRPDTTSTVAIDIYYNDTLQASVAATAYTVAQIPNIYVASGHDRILILHEAVTPYQLVRGASHSSWTLSAFTFNVLPSYDFSLIDGTSYRSTTFTLGATTGTGIALTASAAAFTSNHVGGFLVGNGGRALITAVASTTAATVRITDDFISTTVNGKFAQLYEVMWTSGGGAVTGANRGFPSRGAFFLNRLMLGNSTALRNVVSISTGGVFDDFDMFSESLDAFTAFSVSFNGKGEQSIQTIAPDDSILFLTSNKIFAQSPLVEDPITAASTYFAPQNQSPASNIEAVTIDNQILFVDSNKSQVMQVIYDTSTGKYTSVPAGLLAAHLFGTLNSNSSWDPKGVNTRLFLATQEDGTLLMYSTLVSQQVSGWSLRDTRGKYKQVIGDGRQAHTIVERQINLGTSTFETAMDYAYLSDTTFKAFFDVQADFESVGASTIDVLENQGDYIVMGNDIPWTAIDITLNTNASADCELVFEYLDVNGNWDTFSPTDNTIGLTGNGSITWTFTDVLNWGPGTVNLIENKYWIRIKRGAVSVATLAQIQQVQVNTGVRLYLERFNFDNYTDSTVTVTSDASGNVTGLTNLAGHQVYVIEGNETTGPYFVESDGSVVIESLSATIDIGIQYKPKLVPMPLLAPTQEGDNTYAQKYVQDLYIDYIDSLYLQAGILPEISDIPNMKLGSYTLGQDVAPVTGVYKITPRGNWQPRQEITITQSQPGPMTIIGVGYHVEVA